MESMTASEIRQLRLSLGLTQKEMATRVSVSTQTIKSWELGRRRPVSTAVKVLQAIKEEKPHA